MDDLPDYSFPSILSYIFGMLVLLATGFGISKLFNYYDERSDFKKIIPINKENDLKSTEEGPKKKPKLYQKVTVLRLLKFKQTKPFYKQVDSITGSSNYLSILKPRYSLIATKSSSEKRVKIKTENNTIQEVTTTTTKNTNNNISTKIESNYQRLSIVVHTNVIQTSNNSTTNDEISLYNYKMIESKTRKNDTETDSSVQDGESSLKSSKITTTKPKSILKTRRLSDPYSKPLRPKFRENVVKKRNAEIQSKMSKVFKQHEQHEISLSRMATASSMSIEKESNKKEKLTKITE